MSDLIACTPVQLGAEKVFAAAQRAIDLNLAGDSPNPLVLAASPGFKTNKKGLSVLTAKMWSAKGVTLTVGFLDAPEAALRTRILSHMNAWAKTANVRFVESKVDPHVRIARASGANGGYWSYLGTDILGIAPSMPTMNLQGFTMVTPDREFFRVVRHETGHTMGFPHEHMRRELVQKIDAQKATKYFKLTNNWSPAMVKAQVLTPIEDKSVRGTAHADPNSIMCYQIPGEITVDGKPIPGGPDINESDYAFAGLVYPKPKKP